MRQHSITLHTFLRAPTGLKAGIQWELAEAHWGKSHAAPCLLSTYDVFSKRWAADRTMSPKWSKLTMFHGHNDLTSQQITEIKHARHMDTWTSQNLEWLKFF